jgi:hypothetical protein
MLHPRSRMLPFGCKNNNHAVIMFPLGRAECWSLLLLLQLKSPGVQQEILRAACSDPEVFEILASKTDLVSFVTAPALAKSTAFVLSAAAAALCCIIVCCWPARIDWIAQTGSKQITDAATCCSFAITCTLAPQQALHLLCCPTGIAYAVLFNRLCRRCRRCRRCAI